MDDLRQARAELALHKAALSGLDREIADLEYQIGALSYVPDASERIALSDHLGELLRRKRAIAGHLSETRAAIIRLACTDMYKLTADLAAAALSGLRSELSELKERERAIRADPGRTRQDVDRIDAELSELAGRLHTAAARATSERERYGRWCTWASTREGLQALGIT